MEVGVSHQNIPVSCTSHKVVILVLYRNMVNVAASFYNATINVTSGLSAPYSNLATIYKQQVYYYVPIIAVDFDFLLGFMDNFPCYSGLKAFLGFDAIFMRSAYWAGSLCRGHCML